MVFWKKSSPHASADARIRHALEDLRPLLPVDTVALELDSFDRDTGTARLRMRGTCPDCEMSIDHLVIGIEMRLKQNVPEVRLVELIDTHGTHE